MKWLLLLLLCYHIMPVNAGERPYHRDSPWNLPIGDNPKLALNSEHFTQHFSGVFGIDPNQYTMPVYEISPQQPMVDVLLSGVFSEVTESGTRLTLRKRTTVKAPIPSGARAAKGSDSQIVIWDPSTGDEWGFWQARPLPDGSWAAVNGYRYNTSWSAVPPSGFISRGAGVPYLVGLVRPWEIAQGRIEHAIALGINYPNPSYVFPATKSDGKSFQPHYLPMGARLQLDPALGEADFDRWQLTSSERIIARALQEYGMILIDGSGHPKLYAEYEGTAHWQGDLHNRTLRRIPYDAFRVLSLTLPAPSDAPVLSLTEKDGHQWLEWPPVKGANRYRLWLDNKESEVPEGPVKLPANVEVIRLAAVNWQGVGPVSSITRP